MGFVAGRRIACGVLGALTSGWMLDSQRLVQEVLMSVFDSSPSTPLRDVQIAPRHGDPRTTSVYDRRRQNYDRHAAYALVAFVTSG